MEGKKHKKSFISHKINILNSNFVAHQKDYDLRYLLKLAARIQIRIKIEHDADIKNSLKNDLKIVKAQIGNQILDIPDDRKIFPPVKVTYHSHADSQKQIFPAKSGSSKSVNLNFSDDYLANKFSSYLEQRKKQQTDILFDIKASKKTQKSLNKRKTKT